jgi:hypothetical protein
MTLAISEVLNGIGMEHILWNSPDGSMVMLLPYGGRILGLFPPQSAENFFWTHPALESVETARVFYEGTSWHNSGGDRTWLAPETEFFLPHYPLCDAYVQPPQLDSVKYEIQATSSGVRMVNRQSIPMYAAKTTVKLVLTKEIAQAANPLTEVAPQLASELEYAGYTLTTTLSLDGDSAVAVGTWNLLQLPHRGEMLIRTSSRATPVIYMGQIGADDLRAGEHLVRYCMTAKGEHKFGLLPSDTAGIAAYIYRVGDLSALVIRSFNVNPTGTYIDPPWNGTKEQACAFQTCNIDSGLGAFSELEYHAPAIGGSTGLSHGVDESRVWAFRGPHAAILETARYLVSSEV